MKAMLSIAAGVLLAAGAAHTQSPFAEQKTLTSAAAKRIGEACVALSVQKNLKSSVVVLDAGGRELYVYRMDGANDISLDTARRKAQTAWMFRRPTSQLAEQVRNGGVDNAALMGLFPVLGGMPILVDGNIAGAVGVGGGPPPADEQCALAGMDAAGVPRPPSPAPAR